VYRETGLHALVAAQEGMPGHDLKNYLCDVVLRYSFDKLRGLVICLAVAMHRLVLGSATDSIVPSNCVGQADWTVLSLSPSCLRGNSD
jgi:hypothetical protein